MSRISQHKAAEQLIKSLCAQLKEIDCKLPALVKFIYELDNINYSSIREMEKKNNPKEIASVVSKLPLSNSNFHNIKGLSTEISMSFNWSRMYGKVDFEFSYVKDMFASRLVGLDGYYYHNCLSIGQMLLLPGVTYPFHTHLVEELYYVLSGRLILQHGVDGKPFTLQPGEISITPEGQLHSLRVDGEDPVLLLYSWLGNLTAPIWIWKKIGDHHWERAFWTRLPGKKWTIREKQVVSEELFLSAHNNSSSY